MSSVGDPRSCHKVSLSVGKTGVTMLTLEDGGAMCSVGVGLTLEGYGRLCPGGVGNVRWAFL